MKKSNFLLQKRKSFVKTQIFTTYNIFIHNYLLYYITP